MAASGQVPVDSTQFEVRWNRRSIRRNGLFIALSFLAYVALAVLASGVWHVLGLSGAIVTGLVGLYGGLGSEIHMRRHPVKATLNDSGVTFYPRNPVSWDSIREVRVILLKPRVLFSMRPLRCIAFMPARTVDLAQLGPRERLAMKLYGTSLLLMTKTVTPAAEDILDAVERLSDIPVRR